MTSPPRSNPAPLRVRWLGIPSDSNSSYRRGCALGPAAIRRVWRHYEKFGNSATECGFEIGRDLFVDDLGDVTIVEAEGDHAEIARVAAAAARDAPLLSFGGDHAVTFPLVEGLASVHGPLQLLHFDAHPDLYHDYEGNPRSHASPFARIMERGLARRLVQVGVRTSNAHNREQARRFGVEAVECTQFAPERVPIPEGPLYVTIDLDALDPAFAPGVSHPEPGGLSVRDVIGVLARIHTRIVGADIVELNPTQDIRDATALVCVKLAKELMAAMARGR